MEEEKTMLVSKALEEIRIAILEEDKLSEIFLKILKPIEILEKSFWV